MVEVVLVHSSDLDDETRVDLSRGSACGVAIFLRRMLIFTIRHSKSERPHIQQI